MLTAQETSVVGWLQLLTVALTFGSTFGVNSKAGGLWQAKLL
jgi:hypothetical protein